MQYVTYPWIHLISRVCACSPLFDIINSTAVIMQISNQQDNNFCKVITLKNADKYNQGTIRLYSIEDVFQHITH